MFHGYVGERIYDQKVVKTLVRRICENYRLPYFTITPRSASAHARLSERGKADLPVVWRALRGVFPVTGYLRPVKQWHKGKQEEFRARRLYTVGGDGR